MGIWLGRGQPGELDKAGALVIEFEPGADNAFAFFQDSENHLALESFLQQETDNVKTFQARPPVRAKAASMPTTVQSNSSAPDVGAVQEDLKHLLEDAGIAAVVQEFKGVIVDVKKSQRDI